MQKESTKLPDGAEKPMQAQKQDPKLQKEIEGYLTGLSKLLHGAQTSAEVVKMLETGPPEETIPEAALAVNSQMEDAVREAGRSPSLEVLLNAGLFLVNDLAEIGAAAGLFQLQEEDFSPIITDTLQKYIEKGLKDGTVDPVELQKKVEPLMNDEHKALGMAGAKGTGIPMEANQNTAMQAYGDKMQRRGMMKGEKAGAAPPQAPQGQPQGGE